MATRYPDWVSRQQFLILGRRNPSARRRMRHRPHGWFAPDEVVLSADSRRAAVA
jgi:hypothetical protein